MLPRKHPDRIHVASDDRREAASVLVGGDCNGDADTLRARRTAGVPGCVVKAPSALDTVPRSFRWLPWDGTGAPALPAP